MCDNYNIIVLSRISVEPSNTVEGHILLGRVIMRSPWSRFVDTNGTSVSKQTRVKQSEPRIIFGAIDVCTCHFVK